jgi:carbonic anhydrase
MANPERALPDDLVAGYRRFVTTHHATERARYRQLAAEGQHPASVVVACSDSRTAPEIVFDARPGDLFDIRNVAALVPVYEPDDRGHAASAALEYAVLALAVRSIVVLGHAGCGGIAAALDDSEPLTATDFVGHWVASLRDLADELEPAEWADPLRRQRALELRSIEQSIDNLRTFPWIRSRERAGTLAIHGAWFDVGSGELYGWLADGWVRVSAP